MFGCCVFEESVSWVMNWDIEVLNVVMEVCFCEFVESGYSVEILC